MPLTFTLETLSPALHEGRMADAALGTDPGFAMPSKKAARFPRRSRLLRHADFERVYKQGRRHFSASMTVFYWPRPDEDAESQAGTRARAGVPAPNGVRIGFTVGRALGGAVLRNRMKRRLREAVRLSHPCAGVAADVVINPKKSLLTADFAAILNEVSRAFVIIEQKLSQKPMENRASDSAPKRIVGGRKPEADRRS